MHYTGTIWRPPYEASSLLIEVTAGCTHHKCKFCTLYDDLPFKFRMSPLKDIEEDLAEVQAEWHSEEVNRVYLTGANPFVLKFERLKEIANLIHKYLPNCQTIGCFARVTDITLKTSDELKALHKLGYDGITIGVETGDGEILEFMNKGYPPEEITTQSHRLDDANIKYNYFYLAGISGAGRGKIGALETAKVINQTHPQIIGSSMLTIYPKSELFAEIQAGNWSEETELEKLEELKTLIVNLNIPTFFATLGASNAIFVKGHLPKDKVTIVTYLEKMCKTQNESKLRHYRTHLKHL
ncbi:Radical SAM superfamily protein [Clostridium acidisoli DSM 12555]|uniref:Radical SAM superfamily protein n=1 Tax=Clostridium acidisoli DSM 12555 TaxID=1121291 RepID=A0A1W1X3P5_9CLOT|nr:radical SAM protein [Clostridium acidisoli]SMC18535.1 Radical SAM superfamily protein [Clostridium acidisoli DSM 12555]